MADVIYVRCFAFGTPYSYENKTVSLKNKLSIEFTGPDGPVKLSKKLKKEGGQDLKIKSIITMVKPYIKAKYPDYEGEDIVEGLEISEENDTTTIFIYRSFFLQNLSLFNPNEPLQS